MSLTETPGAPSNLSLPLRLIDVDATLEEANDGHIMFCQAYNWQDFDIISHSWSRHIRTLSKAAAGVAGKQSTKKHTGFAKRISLRILIRCHKIIKGRRSQRSQLRMQRDVRKYTEAFQECNWRNSDDTRKAYLSIKEYLQILQGLGVKKVWLDAICINQRSKDEKEREIPLMAAFYKYSRACYVPINGFGDDEAGKSCKGSCGAADQYNGTYGRYRTITINRCYDDSKWENIEIPPLRCHGCGGLNNYRLPSEQDLPSLRWFNRVWTLQEFILPKNMYFIVQLDSWMEKCLAVIMAATGRHSHFCWQILKEMHDLFNYIFFYSAFTPTSLERALSETIRGVLSVDRQTNRRSRAASTSTFYTNSTSHDDMLSTALKSLQELEDSAQIIDCAECNTKPLLMRRVHHQGQPRLYSVERDALVIALGYLSHAYLNENKNLEDDYYSRICSRYDYLLMMLRREREINDNSSNLNDRSPNQMVGEIRNRSCDEENHPQDRILGILGLLGLIDKCNFTITDTKKSPEAQLVEVASQGVIGMEQLLELSWLDPDSGRNLPGMSWIPDLTGAAIDKWHSENFEMLGLFPITKFTAKFVRVSKKGPIILETHPLKGYFTRDSASQTLVWKSHNSHQFNLQELPLQLPKHSDKPHVYYFSDKTTLTASIHLPFPHVNMHNHIIGFKAWLLPIFVLDNTSSTCGVIICLQDARLFREPGSRLHKIGTLATVEPTFGFDKYWTNLPKERVRISGFGKHFHHHIDMDLASRNWRAM